MTPPSLSPGAPVGIFDSGVGGLSVLRVGYQGSEGAYSYLAGLRHFGTEPREVSYRGYDGFEMMLEALEAEEIDRAILPLENSTSGSVTPNYDLLARLDPFLSNLRGDPRFEALMRDVRRRADAIEV